MEANETEEGLAMVALVETTHGERFVVTGQNTRGVQFDGGTIPWSDIAGYWCWDSTVGRRLFVPAN